MSSADKILALITSKTEAVCRSQLSTSFRFHTVGFGPDEFTTLQAMAAALPAGVGVFHKAGLSLRSRA